MIKVLNLFAGLGGNRKNWGTEYEVTSVEFNESIANVYKHHFPNDTVIIGDAVEYLLEHWREFDFIWASPPCQTHSKIRYMASKHGSYKAVLPDMSLYSIITFLQNFCKDKKWVVENVKPYYTPLIEPTVVLDRHLFWSNFSIDEKKFVKPEVKHSQVTGKTDRYGFSLKDFKLDTRKDQVIRNCVNPEMGLYVLNEAYKE